MNDGLLSQEEIDALLGGDSKADVPSTDVEEKTLGEIITESDKDLLGEIGNISMGSASTALSTILNKKVNITTPKVSLTSIKDIKGNMIVPMVALEVLYTEGLTGANLLVMKIADAAVISSLMMGGDGSIDPEISELGELELSAVSEAMNQMVGSSATSLSTMLGFPVNISPPNSRVWRDKTDKLADHVDENEEIVKIAFSLTIEEHVDSEIMLILRHDTARAIINKMIGGGDEAATPDAVEKVPQQELKQEAAVATNNVTYQVSEEAKLSPSINRDQNVQRAEFAPLSAVETHETKNIDLILDVPLEISVVLGRTKKTIQDILDLGTGSLIELDKLTEEPVEILVNGKKVALGEVVVIDENFGVRITSIINSIDRVKSLQG
ncbi:flagellar motor switch phosphatase FliY [Clostridium cylindrosporum]|uniref:Flagellar motor switch phosphatase FliY n=1 Tax=Clostridium cylindrosporum DSM 605 TaxID=1121307 RepID=A0A0J8DBJ3_CLOCY|nr:flagellar motor switch phosphatase FliY [Clostridium cylindrosporum]KMT21684.1 flagellar motor switch phosphatase FliY [Clostridium cylindrosporum DSM 605]